MPLTAGKQLRDYRRQRGWSQKQCAAVLRVTSNTVARWERGEVRMPTWVSALLDLMASAADETQKVKALKANVTTLQLQNLALENALRQRRQRRTRTSTPSSPPLPAEAVYKRLVRRYHPDRFPEHAKVMADINELWQAVKRHR